MVLAVCMAVTLLSTAAFAAADCPFVRPPGSTRISQSAPRTYTVGEAFNKWAVAIDINNSKSQPVRYDDNLEYWVNGVQIKDGYKFQEVGQKNMVVKRGDKEAGYEFQVIPVLNGNLKECSILSDPASLDYKVGEGFRTGDYAVCCFYTDGSTEDFGGDALSITANGVSMYDGYKFSDTYKQIADSSAGILKGLGKTSWQTKYYDDKVASFTACVQALADLSLLTYTAGIENDDSKLAEMPALIEDYEAKLGAFLDLMGA